MPPKYTYQEVKAMIEKDKENTLVSKKYVNNNTKMKIKCHTCNIAHEATLSVFLQNNGCVVCKKNNRIKERENIKKQDEYNEVQQIITNGGDSLISKEYINSRLKIEICCSKCKQNYKCSLYSFTKGTRCSICLKNNKKNSRIKNTYNSVKNTIESQGDILISTDYINNQTPLKIQCVKCNNVYEETYKSFMQNMRCHICRRKKCMEKSAETRRNNKMSNNKIANNINTVDVIDTIYDENNIDTIDDNIDDTVDNIINVDDTNDNDDFDVINVNDANDKIIEKCIKKNRTKYDIDYVRNIISNCGDTLVSTEYITAKSFIEIKCGKCSFQYSTSFMSFEKGVRCSKCMQIKKGEKLKKSEDEVKNYVESRGDVYVSSFYEKKRHKVIYKCSKCKGQFRKKFDSYVKQKHCICYFNKNINYDFVNKYISDEGDVLESNKYIDFDSPIEIKCHKCNDIYKTTFNIYSKGVRCSLCNIYKKKTTKDMEELVKSDGDILIDNKIEYKNCKTKFKVQCHLCKNEYDTTYTYYKQGHRCIKCGHQKKANDLKHSQENVASYIKECGDTLLSEYVNMAAKLNIKCGKCNCDYTTSFQSYKINGTRCPCFYTISKGEQIIEKYLIKHKINYIAQESFDDCKNIKKLKFDFYLPDLQILIEFDGKIHFEGVEYLGGQNSFEHRFKSDSIKNEYCKNNQKYLFRIAYTDIKQINELMDKYLNTNKHEFVEFSNAKLYNYVKNKMLI